MRNFDEYKKDMIEILKEKYTLEGSIQSEIPSLDFYFTPNPTNQIDFIYEPSLCVILQGDKSVGFGEESFSYKDNQYLVASSYLPANMKIIKASDTSPYMSLRIKFKLEDIYEVLKNIDTNKINHKAIKSGLFYDDMDIELYESIHRLITLLNKDKKDIEFLSPLILKEILYKLAKTKGGYFLNEFSKYGTVSNKIIKAISFIKENFNEKLNIKDLAKHVDMSESSLFQHFKIITQLTPIQFQKKLRLEEAKQLLLLKNIEINQVAYEVGYESPSQFSREFLKLFGTSPKKFVLQNQKSNGRVILNSAPV